MGRGQQEEGPEAPVEERHGDASVSLQASKACTAEACDPGGGIPVADGAQSCAMQDPGAQPIGPIPRAMALTLTLATGFAGLVYEVTWQRYLATLLGSHSEATAAVLGIFLGGLSLGYALFGRVTRRAALRGRAARLLLLYGAIEAAIGLYALAFPWLFRAAQAVSVLMPGDHAGLAFACDVALAALLIGPPTIAMGATIPLLTQALPADLAAATRVHALVYGLNTAGAFAGALCAGFLLVPKLGLVGVLMAMGALNLAAGAAYIALGIATRGEAAAAAVGNAPEGASVVAHFPRYAAAALLTGFAMMTVQTVLIRMGGLAFGSSHFTFALVVAVFVGSIAVGSLGVSALPRLGPRLLVANVWALAAWLVALYLVLDAAPWWAHVLRSVFRDDAGGFWIHQLLVFLGVLVAIGPIGVLGGAVLPLLFHRLRRETGELGATAGRLYSWNTVGSLAGALVGGYALFFWLDLHSIYRVGVGAVIAAAALLAAPEPTARRRRLGLVLALPALAGLALLPAWSEDRLASGLFRRREPVAATWQGPAAAFQFFTAGRKLLFYDDDPVSSISVIQFTDAQARTSRAIVSNGKPDGSIVHDYATTALLGLLPALFADRPERAFVVGYGTGVTAGELAALPSMREVTVAEISSGVLAAAPLFEQGNLGAGSNPKVHLVRGDAYRTLLRSTGRFDVISSEPSNPWVTGVEMLYSVEFLRTARSRLAPGGVFCQWFHSYETDDATLALVLRSYAAAFDEVAVWFGLQNDLLLLGFEGERPDPASELARLAERAVSPAFRPGLRRSGIDDLPTLLAHEIVPRGALHAAALSGPLHTLLHPRLGDAAAHAFFSGGTARPPSLAPLAPARAAVQASLLRRLAAHDGSADADAVEAVAARELCRRLRPECVAWLARAWARHPERRAEAEEAAARMPQDPAEPTAPRALLAELARFVPGATALPPAGSVDPAAAARATERFARHSAAPIPLERAALRAYWNACSSPNPTACADGLAAAERRFGDLREPVID
jgi:spermidine synthase